MPNVDHAVQRKQTRENVCGLCLNVNSRMTKLKGLPLEVYRRTPPPKQNGLVTLQVKICFKQNCTGPDKFQWKICENKSLSCFSLCQM